MLIAAVKNTYHAVRRGRRQPAGTAAPDYGCNNTRPSLASGVSGSPKAIKLPVDLVLGQNGRKWELLDILGYGGMGVVYQARDNDGNLVALKKMAPGCPDNEAHWLRQEAAILSCLHHRHILSLQEAGTTRQGEFFFTAELLQGQNLEQLLRHERLSFARAIDICLQIAQAIRYLHSQDVFHRDLKPANIMITQRDGRDFVKILDFGIAAIKQAGADTVAPDESGSLMYMSPEQAWRLPYSEKSDMYQLGLILFKCLTGRLPFAETVANAITYRLEGQVLPDWLGADTYGSAFHHLLESLLQRDPDQRPDNMQQVVDGLKKVQARMTSARGNVAASLLRRVERRKAA